MGRRFAVLVVAFCASGCANPPPAVSFPDGELVDLSHTYDETTIYWPTSDRFRLEKVSEGVTPAGYYYTANNLFSAEHGGTHIDAPIHFVANRSTVDRIALTQLLGAAVVIDVVQQADKDADYQVTAEALIEWEREHGAIPANSIVLIRTGFSRRWPDAARYLGTPERGAEAVAKLHFPGLHPDAARWLVANRTIKAIGIDTASIDYGQSSRFESHRELLAREIPVYENLTALDRLPPVGAFIIALPMKIGGGSGGPLRAVAILPTGR